jgi:hypothetical protein
VSNLLRLHSQPQNAALTVPLLSLNRKILRSLPLESESEQARPRGFRPPSPVKLLSSFLNSGMSPAHSTNSPQKTPSRTNLLGDVPTIMAPPALKYGSKSKRDEEPSKMTITSSSGILDPLKKLESAFETYVYAMLSKSGNVMGKAVLMRRAADELAVNDLYNTLRKKVYFFISRNGSLTCP